MSKELNSSNPWTRPDHVVDIHFDFEFVDAGNAGLTAISIGAVILGSEKSVRFYGISTEFFRSSKFFEMCASDTEQSNWMFDNVFRHIKGTATLAGKHKRGNITELRDMLSEKQAGFSLDMDQTYPTLHADKTETSGNEPDITIVGTEARIAEAILEAVNEVRTKDVGKENVIRLFCYYCSHDMVAFCNLYGGMMKLPDEFQYFAYDLRQLTDAFGYEHDDYNPNTPHCALSDSIAQYEVFQKLRLQVQKDFGTRLVPEGKW